MHTNTLLPLSQLEVEPDQPAEHVLRLRLTGQLQLATRQCLQQAVADLLRPDTQRVILDLTAVEFLSQEGAGMLLKMHQMLRSWETELALVGAAGMAQETLQRTGLARMIPLFDSVYAAQTAPFSADLALFQNPEEPGR